MRSTLSIAAGLVGVLLSCLPFYVSLLPAMTDVPAHVLVARIIANYDDPVLRYSDYFQIQWAITPTALFYVLLVQLQKLVGPYWDARICLTIWVGGVWLSTWYLARVQRHTDPWIAALVALPLSFSWYAYQGFLPFLMSLPLFTLTVAVWLNDWRSAIKIPSLWALFAFLFGFHIVGAAAAACAIVIAACTDAVLRQRSRNTLIAACLSVLPLLLMTGLYLGGQQAPSSTIRYGGIFSQIVDVVKFTCSTLDDVAGLLMLLWLALVGLALIYCRRSWTAAPTILAGGAVLLALSIAMPGSMGSLWPAGPRLLPFALLLMIAAVRWAEIGGRVVSVTCLALLTGLSVFTARHAIAIDQGYRDILGAADLIEPGKRVLPIVDQSIGSRWTTPYLHAATLYTIRRGGTNPYILADPHVLTRATPLKYRRSSDVRPFAFLYDATRGAADYRGVSTSYDYVLLWGPNSAIADVVGLEMSRVYQKGAATLFARSTE